MLRVASRRVHHRHRLDRASCDADGMDGQIVESLGVVNHLDLFVVVHVECDLRGDVRENALELQTQENPTVAVR